MKMKSVLSLKKKDNKEKKMWLTLAIIISSLFLLAFLLILFLHDASDKTLYLTICICLGLFLVLVDYYFLGYKVAYLNALEKFFKLYENNLKKEKYTFFFEEKMVYRNKLCFRSLQFKDENGEIKTFLLLGEIDDQFVEKKTYILETNRLYLFSSEEINDEE